MATDEAVCSHCGASFSYERKRNPRRACDECKKAIGRAIKARWAERNRDAIRARGRAYMRQRYREDPEHFRAEARAYREAHVEEARRRCREWYAKNAATALAYAAEYRDRNRERINDYAKRKYEADPDRLNAIRQAYRARERARRVGAEGEWTPQDFERLCYQQGGLCAYCNQPMERPVVDHATPLCRAGSNFIENIRATCGDCNSRKTDKTEDEFFELIAEFPGWLGSGRHLREFRQLAGAIA